MKKLGKTIMRILLFLSIVLLFSIAVNGQVAIISPTVISNAGENFVLPNSGYTGSYTIGELLITTLRSDSNIITQGFQQADPVQSVSIHEELTSDQEIKVFPNPTANFVTFEINQLHVREIKVYLVDMLGRVLNSQSLKATSGQLVFDLSEMADSYYFLRAVNANGNAIGTYKVQKIN